MIFDINWPLPRLYLNFLYNASLGWPWLWVGIEKVGRGGHTKVGTGDILVWVLESVRVKDALGFFEMLLKSLRLFLVGFMLDGEENSDMV